MLFFKFHCSLFYSFMKNDVNLSISTKFTGGPYKIETSVWSYSYIDIKLTLNTIISIRKCYTPLARHLGNSKADKEINNKI